MRQETAETSQQVVNLIGGIALGALAMYLADPSQGRQRRALAQDSMRRMTSRTGTVVNEAVRDAGHRLSGLQAQASRLMGQRAKPIDDHVLEARVRSRMGRIVAHSHPVQVTAHQGRVTLSGPVLAHEREQLLDLVQAIPGVEDVRDRMEVHDRMEDQEGGNWSMLRILAAIGGGALGYYGMTRRTASGMSLAAAGLGLLASALRGQEMREWVGMPAHASQIDIEKSIEIRAAPETVFDVWSKHENFPQFMAHVVEVRDLGQRRSHWVVRGPAGRHIEWDSVLTESSRPQALAWRSEPGTLVQHSGSVRLEPTTDGTRATVRMTYTPPAGFLGQGLATLFGSDPAQVLEDDLLRMKDFIENGVPPHEGAPAVEGARQILH